MISGGGNFRAYSAQTRQGRLRRPGRRPDISRPAPDLLSCYGMIFRAGEGSTKKGQIQIKFPAGSPEPACITQQSCLAGGCKSSLNFHPCPQNNFSKLPAFFDLSTDR